MLAEEAGCAVTACESGEEALETLRREPAPDAMLIDMQMPGLSGDELAAELRAICGPDTRLIAMSGTEVPAAARSGFTDFLLKPFSGEDLAELLGGAPAEALTPAPAPALAPAGLDPTMINEETFHALQQTMPKTQVWALYSMCLDDADARLATVRKASEDRDADAFRRAAHSIKGGCGMVGAVELARMATAFEQNGPPMVHTVVPFDDFLEASARLRGMLGRVLNDL